MVPSSYIFAFILDYKFLGVWLGVPIGSLVSFFGLGTVILSLDWQELAVKAAQRVEMEKNAEKYHKIEA